MFNQFTSVFPRIVGIDIWYFNMVSSVEVYIVFFFLWGENSPEIWEVAQLTWRFHQPGVFKKPCVFSDICGWWWFPRGFTLHPRAGHAVFSMAVLKRWPEIVSEMLVISCYLHSWHKENILYMISFIISIAVYTSYHFFSSYHLHISIKCWPIAW